MPKTRAERRRIGRRGDPERTARINLLIAPHDREAWFEAAHRAGLSLSEYVRRAVEAWIAADNNQSLPVTERPT
jgi:hypothetical protein